MPFVKNWRLNTKGVSLPQVLIAAGAAAGVAAMGYAVTAKLIIAQNKEQARNALQGGMQRLNESLSQDFSKRVSLINSDTETETNTFMVGTDHLSFFVAPFPALPATLNTENNRLLINYATRGERLINVMNSFFGARNTAQQNAENNPEAPAPPPFYMYVLGTRSTEILSVGIEEFNPNARSVSLSWTSQAFNPTRYAQDNISVLLARRIRYEFAEDSVKRNGKVILPSAFRVLSWEPRFKFSCETDSSFSDWQSTPTQTAACPEDMSWNDVWSMRLNLLVEQNNSSIGPQEVVFSYSGFGRGKVNPAIGEFPECRSSMAPCYSHCEGYHNNDPQHKAYAMCQCATDSDGVIIDPAKTDFIHVPKVRTRDAPEADKQRMSYCFQAYGCGEAALHERADGWNGAKGRSGLTELLCNCFDRATQETYQDQPDGLLQFEEDYVALFNDFNSGASTPTSPLSFANMTCNGSDRCAGYAFKGLLDMPEVNGENPHYTWGIKRKFNPWQQCNCVSQKATTVTLPNGNPQMSYSSSHLTAYNQRCNFYDRFGDSDYEGIKCPDNYDTTQGLYRVAGEHETGLSLQDAQICACLEATNQHRRPDGSGGFESSSRWDDGGHAIVYHRKGAMDFRQARTTEPVPIPEMNAALYNNWMPAQVGPNGESTFGSLADTVIPQFQYLDQGGNTQSVENLACGALACSASWRSTSCCFAGDVSSLPDGVKTLPVAGGGNLGNHEYASICHSKCGFLSTPAMNADPLYRAQEEEVFALRRAVFGVTENCELPTTCGGPATGCDSSGEDDGDANGGGADPGAPAF